MMYNLSTEICDTYYQLGYEESRWRFPFNLIQKKFPSGLQSFDNKSSNSVKKNKASLRHKLVNQVLFPALEWLGLIHSLSKIKMSIGFKKWLNEYKPEILYLQVSTREDFLFATNLKEYLRIPSAIHMMDDWPTTISQKGLFRKYWANRIDHEFRKLLERTDLFLSISDAMSEEYQKRYGKRFIPFHNPVCVSKYKQKENNSLKDVGLFKILYIGRIGVANKNSIYDFAIAISHFRTGTTRIIFDIYTSDTNSLDAKRLSKLESVKVHSAINHEEVPGLLKEYDLLLLPLDFTKHGLEYARYSIPTKASEYMASGTPILVYAPKETAISQFCFENECGCCVTEHNPVQLKNAIL